MKVKALLSQLLAKKTEVLMGILLLAIVWDAWIPLHYVHLYEEDLEPVNGGIRLIYAGAAITLCMLAFSFLKRPGFWLTCSIACIAAGVFLMYRTGGLNVLLDESVAQRTDGRVVSIQSGGGRWSRPVLILEVDTASGRLLRYSARYDSRLFTLKADRTIVEFHMCSGYLGERYVCRRQSGTG